MNKWIYNTIKYIYLSGKHVTNWHVSGWKRFLFGTQRNVAIFKMLTLKTGVILKNALYLFLIIFIRLLTREHYVVREYMQQEKAFSVKGKDQNRIFPNANTVSKAGKFNK